MQDVNFDGLVGPTHHYAGLAPGNVASARHKGSVSSPKEAALQGLEKAEFLRKQGVPQCVLPPVPRPAIERLRQLGFSGDLPTLLLRAHCEAPALLRQCFAASSMWTANAATVSPSADTADGRVHITPANLISAHHRAIETPSTAHLLRLLLPPGPHFVHHAPLPAAAEFADEGAANHMRIGGMAAVARDQGGSLQDQRADKLQRGSASVARECVAACEVFVYGRDGLASAETRAGISGARQTLQASQAVARLHGLSPKRSLFVRQRAEAVRAGVFHNDVIAVAHEHLLLSHAHAFEEGEADRLREGLRAAGVEHRWIEVPASRLSLAEAVSTYLFNSQIVSVPQLAQTAASTDHLPESTAPAKSASASAGSPSFLMLAPMECEEHPEVSSLLREITEGDAPIDALCFLDLRQSMRNGGGPACLRLRVPMTEAEMEAVHPGCWLTEAKTLALRTWVHKHYRDRLHEDDLRDPSLVEEARAALDELTSVLGMGGSLYDFQRVGSEERPKDD